MNNIMWRSLIITALLAVCSTLLAREPSQAELDAACEKAREQQLAPLREAEISQCKKDKKMQPGQCEQYFADFGDGGRVGGRTRARMFDDLPECVAANKKRDGG